eukprot:TRINITY_DN28745_c0_g1_i1.p1 TRINITY_DN28745_c0_g1~~TRINITY_DN28745_c0_g1_i1.p1  ORF type:complete len:231 (-),score=43.46 TRINITY_DN28745_c0_g1_i1:58-750(-)
MAGYWATRHPKIRPYPTDVREHNAWTAAVRKQGRQNYVAALRSRSGAPDSSSAEGESAAAEGWPRDGITLPAIAGASGGGFGDDVSGGLAVWWTPQPPPSPHRCHPQQVSVGLPDQTPQELRLRSYALQVGADRPKVRQAVDQVLGVSRPALLHAEIGSPRQRWMMQRQRPGPPEAAPGWSELRTADVQRLRGHILRREYVEELAERPSDLNVTSNQAFFLPPPPHSARF